MARIDENCRCPWRLAAYLSSVGCSVMAFLYGDLRLRPTRIGFLVRPSDLTNLQKVFQICSCLWGGMYNPIIPVSRSLPKAWRSRVLSRLSGRQLAMGYVRFFEPDVFVETESGMAQSVGILQGTSGLYPRVLSLDNLMEARHNSHPEFAAGLNIFDVYKELYQTEFQFVRRGNSFVALFRDGDLAPVSTGPPGIALEA